MKEILRRDTTSIEYWSAVSFLLVAFFSVMYSVFPQSMAIYQSNLNWALEMIFLGSVHIYSIRKNIEGLRVWAILISGFIWLMYGLFSIETNISTTILSLGLSLGLGTAFFSRSFVQWK